jgi:hypothetical protein
MSSVIEEYKQGNRKAVIILEGETLCIDFYKDDRHVNNVEYPNNSIYFVQDAAENYVNGILNFD